MLKLEEVDKLIEIIPSLVHWHNALDVPPEPKCQPQPAGYLVVEQSPLSSQALIQRRPCVMQYALQFPYLVSILFANTVHGPS